MKARTLALILVGLVGLAVLAIVLGGFLFAGWFTLEPATGEAAIVQESAVITKQHVNERLGYSLHYPQAYSIEEQENGDSFVIGSSMNHSDPRLTITVSDAQGATAKSAADALAGSLDGFDLERYTWVIDGREAQVVDGVPGQELSRVVFLVNEGRLYRLSFTHADETLGDTYTQMEELFLIVAGSFRLNPVVQQAATGPASEAGITVEAATATPQPIPSTTSTANVGESAAPAATYEDEVAGFVVDYPAGWHVVDVAPQIKAGANNYTVSFLSWQPEAGRTEGIPEEGTKVDVSARPGPAATLQEAAEGWKRQVTAGPGQTLLSEATMITDGGLQAVRWTVQSPFGRSLAVLTVVKGRPILLSGQGDETIVEWMAKSLRPSGQAGSGEGPVVQTATPEPPSGLPLLGSSGAPPSTGCVVYQSGRVRDEELPKVHAAPDPASDLIGQLGRDRWANGLQRQAEWIEIALGNGRAGWIKEAGVGLTDGCAFDVPLIMNRGAPANDRCLAMVGEPGGHTVDVRSAPGENQARVALLVNWAEVRQSAGGWHEIEIPQGGSGWVEGSQVVLSAGCE